MPIFRADWLLHRSLWTALHAELNAWHAVSAEPCLWWRDDDAAVASPQLDRLLQTSRQYLVPIAIAAIPATLDPSLASCLRSNGARVTVLQHGVDHIDRGLDGVRREFPAEMPSLELSSLLLAGRMRLADILDDAIPALVPPWNTVQPNLLAAARQAGYAGVSAFGGVGCRKDDLLRIDCHLDLLRWRPTPHFKGEGRLLRRLIREMRRRRRQQRLLEPIGLLSHHLDMTDEACWDFLKELFDCTAGRVAWIEPWSQCTGTSADKTPAGRALTISP